MSGKESDKSQLASTLMNVAKAVIDRAIASLVLLILIAFVLSLFGFAEGSYTP